MKKRFSLILTSVVSLILALVIISGCSFIDNSSKTNYGDYTDTDSIISAQSVKFNTTAKTSNIEDAFIEAVEKVDRSSVQILTVNGGAGSGVIVDISVDSTGINGVSWKQDDNIVYIITCHHMVSKENTFGTEGIGEIEITLPDENYAYDNSDYVFSGYIGNGTPSEYKQQGYAVTLVGGDFESDIALLKLDLSVAAKSGKKLSKDKIGKAQLPDFSTGYKVKKGETVFSIGNPTGAMPGSVARGVVSYLARETSVSEVGNMTLMQIDVSTNPGSSGGGLYNLYGELIGITNAGNTSYTNINFAIPCYLENGNGFAEIAAQLLGTATENNYGYVSGRKIKFGFTVSEGTDNGSSYVYVASVSSGSISAKSGLKQKDTVLSLEVKRGDETVVSKKIATISDFSAVFDKLAAGDSVKLSVERRTESYWGRVSMQTVTVDMVAEGFLFCNTGK